MSLSTAQTVSDVTSGLFSKGPLPDRLQARRNYGPLNAGDVIEWDPARHGFFSPDQRHVFFPAFCRRAFGVLFTAAPIRITQLEIAI